MEKNQNRTILKLNEKIKIDAGIKAYLDGFITNPDRLARFVETIMRMYIDGKLENLISIVDDYSSTDTIRTSQVNPELKYEFGIKAYNNGLIKNPRYVARLIENILKDYLKGKLDKVFKK